MKRVSFTLPDQVLDDLTYVSRRVGVSRSAVLSEVIGPAFSEMRRLLEDIRDVSDSEEAVRLRGKSAALVEKRIANLRRLTSDLFSE